MALNRPPNEPGEFEMFGEVQNPTPRADTPDQKRHSAKFDVSQLSMSELLNLRGRIDERLPSMTLDSMNLESELVLQYQTVKSLQVDTLEDDYVEPNKKASVVNACAAALGSIVKLQTDLYTAERFKSIETILIRTLKTLPKETVEKFIDEYEALGKAQRS